jgi:Fe-S cluster biogenesis protein NfuA
MHRKALLGFILVYLIVLPSAALGHSNPLYTVTPNLPFQPVGTFVTFLGTTKYQDGGSTDFVYVKVRGSCLELNGTWRGCPSSFVEESCGGCSSATRQVNYFCSQLGLTGPPTYDTVRTRTDGYIIHHGVVQPTKIRYSTTTLVKCP